MITQQKFKLFSNDPKFKGVNVHDQKMKELVILKIYAGQKQTRKKNVIEDSIIKRNNPYPTSTRINIDFLQSRTQSLQQKLLSDIQDFYEIKKSIKQGQQNRQRIQFQLNGKLREIIEQTERLEVIHEQKQTKDIEVIEKFVEQIDRLNTMNEQLIEQNQILSKRVKNKQKKLQRYKKSKQALK